MIFEGFFGGGFFFACQDFWISVPPYFQEQCYVPEYVWGNQTIVYCLDSSRISILETLHNAVHIINLTSAYHGTGYSNLIRELFKYNRSEIKKKRF